MKRFYFAFLLLVTAYAGPIFGNQILKNNLNTSSLLKELQIDISDNGRPIELFAGPFRFSSAIYFADCLQRYGMSQKIDTFRMYYLIFHHTIDFRLVSGGRFNIPMSLAVIEKIV